MKTIHLDPPVWSLDHEMRISILFPFLFWCVARFLKKSVWIALIVSVCCTVAIRASTGSYAEGFNDSTVHATWLETGYFIFFFALGSYMAIRWQAVVESALFLPKGAKVLLFAVLCFFLLIGDGGGKAFVSSAVDYLRGFSSAGIIALAAASQRLAAALNHGVLTWLGRISFSLYLVHVPTILSVAFACGSAWSPISLSALAILLSLFIATLISAAVEYPCIKLGKSVAALFQPARAQQRFQEVPLVRQLER